MFWGILGIIFLVLMYLCMKFWVNTPKGSDGKLIIIPVVLMFLIWFIPALSVTANTWQDSVKAKNSTTLIKAKTEQRDVLLAGVKDALSADSFAALMAATPKADLIVLLGNQTSSIMVERAKQIVDLNSVLFDLQNQVTHLRIRVCNTNDNPFMPQLPFALPECKL